MKVFAFSIPTSKGTKTLNMKCLRKRKCNHKLEAWFFTTLHYNTPKSKRTEKNYHLLSKNHVKKFSQFQANFTYLDNNKKIFLGKYIIIGWTIHLKKRKLSLKMICLLALDIKNYTKRITKIISGKATLNQFYFDYKNYIYCSMRKDLEIFLIYLTTYFWPLFPLNFP